MKGQENLKPSAKGRKGGRRQVNPAQLDTFCLQYRATGSAERAAVAAGYRPSYAYELLHKPEVKERLRDIREKVADETAKLIAKRSVITEDFLDTHLADVIRHGGGHPHRGEADRLKGIETGYKKLKLIGSSNQPIAQGDQPVRGTIYEIYKAKWLRDKEAELYKKYEEEYAAGQLAVEDGNGTK